MLERRRHSRARNFAAGTVTCRPRAPGPVHAVRASVDCVVRDVSEGGAMLLLDEPRCAPLDMELASLGEVRPARVVWRGETAVGIAFTAVPGLPATAAVPAAVVDLDAVRRRKARGDDGARLAERIARFVRPSRRPDPA